jgi:hypothetical protein
MFPDGEPPEEPVDDTAEQTSSKAWWQFWKS